MCGLDYQADRYNAADDNAHHAPDGCRAVCQAIWQNDDVVGGYRHIMCCRRALGQLPLRSLFGERASISNNSFVVDIDIYCGSHNALILNDERIKLKIFFQKLLHNWKKRFNFAAEKQRW